MSARKAVPSMSTFSALLQFGQQNAMQFHSEPFAVEMPVTVSCRTWVNVRAQWGQIAMFVFRWRRPQYGIVNDFGQCYAARRRLPAGRGYQRRPMHRWGAESRSMNGPKISRNALCPCGSGQKFKRCHGLRGEHHYDPTATQIAAPPVDPVVARKQAEAAGPITINQLRQWVPGAWLASGPARQVLVAAFRVIKADLTEFAAPKVFDLGESRVVFCRGRIQHICSDMELYTSLGEGLGLTMVMANPRQPWTPDTTLCLVLTVADTEEERARQEGKANQRIDLAVALVNSIMGGNAVYEQFFACKFNFATNQPTYESPGLHMTKDLVSDPIVTTEAIAEAQQAMTTIATMDLTLFHGRLAT